MVNRAAHQSMTKASMSLMAVGEGRGRRVSNRRRRSQRKTVAAALAHAMSAARKRNGLSALNLTARQNSKWANAQKARVIPQPGQG